MSNDQRQQPLSASESLQLGEMRARVRRGEKLQPQEVSLYNQYRQREQATTRARMPQQQVPGPGASPPAGNLKNIPTFGLRHDDLNPLPLHQESNLPRIPTYNLEADPSAMRRSSRQTSGAVPALPIAEALPPRHGRRGGDPDRLGASTSLALAGTGQGQLAALSMGKKLHPIAAVAEAVVGQAKKDIGGAATEERAEKTMGIGRPVGALTGAAAFMAGGASLDSASGTLNPLTQGVMKATEVLRDWSDTLHKSNMKFAEFSGSMARVQAEAEMRQIQFEQRRGEARATTARDLAEARDRLSRAMAPFEDSIANFRNRLATAFIDKMLPILEKIADRLGLPKDEDTADAGNFVLEMQNIANAAWTETYGRPGHLNHP